MGSRRVVGPDRLALACLRLGSIYLRDFTAMIIANVSDGGVLDDSALASIRTECIRQLQNADPAGLSVEQEAEVVGKTVKNVENLIDSAISQGRDRQKR